ncbi:polysaccharide deacetylase family protein [Pseudogracilibacillus sp. ICA-222130]|uniref:polysaccharide deacetylase family protein n=1 Tax=Pseudogracilibacillus sp. ICA-222130 TaxID=3134655 RepID=UPI0030BACE2F
MFKNLTWPIVLVIISVILTVGVVFSGIILMEIEKVTSAKAVTMDVEKEEIDDQLILETKMKEAELYTSKITQPVINKKTIDGQIERWIRQHEDDFMEEMLVLMEEKRTLEEGENNHLVISTDYYKANEDIYTFLLKGSFVKNDKEIDSFQQFFTVNIKEDKFVSLHDVVEMNEPLKNLIKKEINKQDFEVDEKDFEMLTNNEENIQWALTEDSILFFYEKETIGNNEEEVEVAIPYVDAYKSLTEAYYALLITDEMQQIIDSAPRELDPNGKYIALTFDDGPDEQVTPRILETLDEFDAKATFYMLGRNASRYPHIAEMVAQDGHEIANHSITHPNLNAITAQAIKDEISLSQQQIKDATGIAPTSFRPPYGEYNNMVLEQAKQTDQIVTMWTIDTLDWQSKNTNAILHNVSMSTNGDIVLMHDIHPTTADALPTVMKYLQDQGFEFITVSEMIQLEENHIEVGPYYGTKKDDNEQAY